MKLSRLALAIPLFFAGLAGQLHAQDVSYTKYTGWCEQGGQTTQTNSINSSPQFPIQRSYPQCNVTVYIHGSNLSTKAQIYSDDAGTVPLANPFAASTTGLIGFYVAVGRYDIQESGSNIPSPITLFDQYLEAGGGGGGGGGCGISSPCLISQGGTSATTATQATINLQFLEPYTGGVARSDAAKFGDQVSVLDFAADNTCTNDARPQIQAAINVAAQRASTSHGVEVFVPSGCYNIGSPGLEISGVNVSLRGENAPSTTLVYTAATGGLLRNYNYAGVLSNMTFKLPNATDFSVYGIWTNSQDVEYRNLITTNCENATAYLINNANVVAKPDPDNTDYIQGNVWDHVESLGCKIGFHLNQSNAYGTPPAYQYMGYNQFANINTTIHTGQIGLVVDAGPLFRESVINQHCFESNMGSGGDMFCAQINNGAVWDRNTYRLDGEYNPVGGATGNAYTVQVNTGGTFKNVDGYVDVRQLTTAGVFGSQVPFQNNLSATALPSATLRQQDQPSWDNGTFTMPSASTATPWTAFRDDSVGQIGIMNSTTIHSPYFMMNSSAANAFLFLGNTGNQALPATTVLASINNIGTGKFNGGVQLNTVITRPTCAITLRGLLWDVYGGTGVADQQYFCIKKSDDTYDWASTQIAISSSPGQIITNVGGVVQGVNTIASSQSTFTQTGASTVRTAQDKLTDYVSAKDFGADSTGATSSSANVLTALNTGRNIFFPCGTYKMNVAYILPTSGKAPKIIGEGTDCVTINDALEGRAFRTFGQANALLIFTAVVTGRPGIAVSIDMQANAPSQTLSVTTTGNAVVVTLGTNGSSAVTSTAAQVAAICNGDPTTAAIVTVTTAPGTGASVVSPTILIKGESSSVKHLFQNPIFYFPTYTGSGARSASITVENITFVGPNGIFIGGSDNFSAPVIQPIIRNNNFFGGYVCTPSTGTGPLGTGDPLCGTATIPSLDELQQYGTCVSLIKAFTADVSLGSLNGCGVGVFMSGADNTSVHNIRVQTTPAFIYGYGDGVTNTGGEYKITDSVVGSTYRYGNVTLVQTQGAQLNGLQFEPSTNGIGAFIYTKADLLTTVSRCEFSFGATAPIYDVNPYSELRFIGNYTNTLTGVTAIGSSTYAGWVGSTLSTVSVTLRGNSSYFPNPVGVPYNLEKQRVAYINPNGNMGFNAWGLTGAPAAAQWIPDTSNNNVLVFAPGTNASSNTTKPITANFILQPTQTYVFRANTRFVSGTTGPNFLLAYQDTGVGATTIANISSTGAATGTTYANYFIYFKPPAGANGISEQITMKPTFTTAGDVVYYQDYGIFPVSDTISDELSGSVALTGGTATVSFARTWLFSLAKMYCTGTNITNATPTPVKITYTGTKPVLTIVSGAGTDTVNYSCIVQ